MPDKYERDDDRVDELLRDTHETIGRLRTLLGVLGNQITDLEDQVRPCSREGKHDG